MKKKINNQKGFTLIELVMVIAILGLLAAVAIPAFTDYETQAKDSAMKGVAGGVRAGIMTQWMAVSPKAYPAVLDGVDAGAGVVVCKADNPSFTAVLKQGGITDGTADVGWRKKTPTDYAYKTGAATEMVYRYTAASGSFIELP